MGLTGLNSLSRYSTSCSARTSRMLAWVRTSANGSPWSRAKRARTASSLVIEWPSASGIKVVSAALSSAATGRHNLFFAGSAAQRTAYASAIRHGGGGMAGMGDRSGGDMMSMMHGKGGMGGMGAGKGGMGMMDMDKMEMMSMMG